MLFRINQAFGSFYVEAKDFADAVKKAEAAAKKIYTTPGIGSVQKVADDFSKGVWV